MVSFSDNMGLVLEGGGMRGVFTSGVLDYMMDCGMRFPYCVAVSAGACNGLSYKSRQRGRARRSNIDLLEQYRYIGMRHFLKQHSIFDLKMMFDDLPNKILPFDYDACFSDPMHYEMVTTNCQTGEACYLSENADRKRLLDICRASSSLPYVCPIVNVDNVPMLDGGIADSIPIERAISQGFERNVVVLTRNRGYRKKSKDWFLSKFIYHKYPRLQATLKKRFIIYNQQLELIERLEAEEKVVVIRPVKPIEVNRLEKDTSKLTALYEEGYECAKRVLRL